MRYLKTNTAVVITVGPFYDSTDGVTIKDNLTPSYERISAVVDLGDGNAPTIVLDNIAGGISGTSNDLNYITNCDAGLMQLELSADDTNYLGNLFVTITGNVSGSVTGAATHVPVFHEFSIISSQMWGVMFGTGNLNADIKSLNGDTVAAGNLSKSASTIYQGTVTGAATINTLIDSGLNQVYTDHWKGRIVIFSSGGLKYQATDITGFTSATDELTFTTLTAAPSGADTYVVI